MNTVIARSRWLSRASVLLARIETKATKQSPGFEINLAKQDVSRLRTDALADGAREVCWQ